jgi:hypothetical protein
MSEGKGNRISVQIDTHTHWSLILTAVVATGASTALFHHHHHSLDSRDFGNLEISKVTKFDQIDPCQNNVMAHRL